MKYIITLSLLIITVIILNSCNDSLGIERNVIITTIDTNGNDTTGKDTIQKIPASIDSFEFHEEFLMDGISYEFPINEQVTFQEAFVDTSRDPIYVWVRLNIINKYGDDRYQAIGRKEYTQSIRFTADSLQGVGPFKLIGSPNSGYWSELGVRNIDKKDSTFLSGSQSNFDIQFRSDFKNHQITAITYAKIPNPAEPDNPTYVTGNFIIKYPK
ncbi:MAG: hypothetical protein A2X61_02560 [Ignavibacteria bacterium GWB2_35_12]|nr:MAG: hypothetical protein A2X63_11390 [Ignavibacteria bacterium GWA2_35_8]OGU42460.1 MAG: hypothetical protein A2X61_02560 [Ignavibacteria bacterium GWB2_35_12]OGU96629.1 MAG: hypothetical protein A2220_12140 [Ignavibacteria bacterium RIFOXYA2_FULL_35_10]OGV24240.1 MAG: hypothetical protein A2475_08485 [Ignavibacteria bacterium RIFOXYC2_FULL_35_21]